MPTEYEVYDGDELVEVFDEKEEAVICSMTDSPPGESYRVEERQYNTTEETDSATNMNYDFIATDDDAQDETNDFDTVGSMWTLGDHSAVRAENRQTLVNSLNSVVGELDDEIDGDVKAVLEDAAGLVENTSVTRFECPVEECGLGHSHPDHKHDIRSGFNVTSGFADNMEFCPYCHCGVNEMAMLMQFYPYISVDVFEDGDLFEGVYELDPDVLEDIYRRSNEDDISTLRAAIKKVAGEYGVPSHTLVPMDIRDDIQAFFARRRSIEGAANSAPIASETRKVIGENRDALEEVTSE